jgi:hypothetical protein
MRLPHAAACIRTYFGILMRCGVRHRMPHCQPRNIPNILDATIQLHYRMAVVCALCLHVFLQVFTQNTHLVACVTLNGRCASHTANEDAFPSRRIEVHLLSFHTAYTSQVHEDNPFVCEHPRVCAE